MEDNYISIVFSKIWSSVPLKNSPSIPSFMATQIVRLFLDEF
jgi:hypothetical protein